MAFSAEACMEKHKSVSWMFGTLITMQLMCFSWLGYLSMRVIALETTTAATTATVQTKLEELDKNINMRFDHVTKHLDDMQKLITKD